MSAYNDAWKRAWSLGHTAWHLGSSQDAPEGYFDSREECVAYAEGWHNAKVTQEWHDRIAAQEPEKDHSDAICTCGDPDCNRIFGHDETCDGCGEPNCVCYEELNDRSVE